MTLETWLGRLLRSAGGGRRVLLLEFIRRTPEGVRRLAYPLWFRLIARPAIRRSMLWGQVLTEWEAAHYASMFSIPRERLLFVPWPLSSEADELPPFDPEASVVMSSGRVACDWETLFTAARARGWQMTVVTRRREARALESLNRGMEARLLYDIPFAEHHSLLRQAAVYVMSMRESRASGGQVRLSNAIRAGAPVVSTAIRGLEGYVEDGRNAILVQPGDWKAMGEAVDSLLEDPQRRRRLRRRAFEDARKWTYEQYFLRMREIVTKALEETGKRPAKV